MDLMSIRRKMLMSGGKKVIDTSPKIVAYDSTYGINGNIVNAEGYCCTALYSYLPMQIKGTIAYYGTSGKIMVLYKNNGSVKVDYWILQNEQSPRTCINVGTDSAVFTLEMSKLPDCYAYIVDTGQILFAGKNSLYYGYTNINDMPT